MSGLWRKLRTENAEAESRLEPENQKYINKVIQYSCTKGLGILEGEVVKRDLIGIAQECEQEKIRIQRRLGEVEEFAKSLSLEGGKAVGKEKLYYGIWNFGRNLVIMTLLSMYFWGIGQASVKLGLFLWVFGYSLLGTVYLLFLRYRFVLESRVKFYMAAGTVLALGCFLLYWRHRAAVNGESLMISGQMMWLLVFAGGILYGAGRLLFEKYTEETAREYHWEL